MKKSPPAAGGGREGDDSPSPLSRRTFLKLAGAASMSAGVLGCSTIRWGGGKFDETADVLVVGSGAAGASAAIFAKDAGAGEVVLVEKALLFGGTTAKSGGVYWIPNNSFLRERGITTPRNAMLREMASHSYPHLYQGDSPTLGLPENEYELLVAFYDNAAPAVERLAEIGALVSQPAEVPFGPMPDYFEDSREDLVPVDRRLWPRKADGSFGLGDEMVRQLKSGCEQIGVEIRMGEAAAKILANEEGQVVGLETQRTDGSSRRLRARRGVIFGSGGYTHNAEMMLHYQPGPLYGGCAVPTNQGDFITMAGALGAKMGHMQSAWYAEIVLEQALQFSSTPDDVFMPPGDSMILVNRLGKRVVNEKANYNERTQAHFYWDPVSHDWPNRFLFMVYDQRTAELYGGRFPLPAAGTQAPYVLKADTLTDLAREIDARLEGYADRTGGFTLDIEFPDRLASQIRRFNKFADKGVDLEFDRGGHVYDRDWHSRIWSFPNQDTEHALGTKPNPTMHPISADGPYYAIVLAAGTLDTNGGPVIDSNAQVLDVHSRPIAGLYGAGNCIASPTGRYYYGGGGTLGPALAFAYIAGRTVAAEPVKMVK